MTNNKASMSDQYNAIAQGLLQSATKISASKAQMPTFDNFIETAKRVRYD